MKPLAIVTLAAFLALFAGLASAAERGARRGPDPTIVEDEPEGGDEGEELQPQPPEQDDDTEEDAPLRPHVRPGPVPPAPRGEDEEAPPAPEATRTLSGPAQPAGPAQPLNGE